MVHVSPWEATLGLLAGAARVLPRGGPLVLYGPYRRDDVPTAASNEAFDASLQARDPRWGLRRGEDGCEAAKDAGSASTGWSRCPPTTSRLCSGGVVVGHRPGPPPPPPPP